MGASRELAGTILKTAQKFATAELVEDTIIPLSDLFTVNRIV